MTKRMALVLVVAAMSCTTDLSVRREDGNGQITGEADIESGTAHAIFASPGETGRAYHDVVHADTLETVCKADPNSAACVVGMAEDPRTAAYILRRGYGRPFGGSARVYPLAGAPARLATADDGFNVGPDTVALAPPPPPRVELPYYDDAAVESVDMSAPRLAVRTPTLARPAVVEQRIVRCSALQPTLLQARDKIRAAQAARKGLKSDADAEAVAAAQATLKQRLAEAGRMLGDGISACVADPQAIRELVEIRSKIPELRETYGLPKEG